MARILIVDDAAVNRELLHAYLEGGDHELVDAESGEQAILLAKESHPDIVLLDVMMGRLNGFDTTQRLKHQAGEEFLPIILLTSLTDPQSRVLGLRMGADEFLTKPVDRLELDVRVKNLLVLRAKDRVLKARTVELAELLRFRDEMSSLIVHDLKNPMSVISANHDYLIEESKNQEPEYLSALHDSQNATRRIMRLLANLLDVARLEERRLDIRRTPTSVARLLSEIAKQRTLVAEARQIVISVSSSVEKTIRADADLLTRAVENVFDNALRYTPAGGRIEVVVEETGQGVNLRIGNTGAAIPVEVRTAIFDKYNHSASASGRLNMGLGLYFCRLAAEAHDGRIWVEETEALPTVFVIELPA